MSVGLQRLRDEPDVIRDGAIDKGEDPALVDRALELDAARRRLLGESETLKAERNAASKQIGEAIKGGAAPDGPEVADLRAASTRRRRRGSTALDAELAEIEADARRPAPAHPEPARPGHPGRWRGGQRHDPDLGRAARRTTSRSTARSAPTRRPAARPGRAGRTGSSARRSTSSTTPAARRSPAPASRSTRAPGPRSSAALINWFLDVHTRENGMTEVWPPAVVNTAQRHGHRPDPGQGRPDVRRDPRRAVPGPDRRGPGHEPPPRRDPRGGRAADPLRGLLAVLPARGRRRRQGHPRHPPRPPVRQGRDGPVRAPGGLARRPSSG